jgi:16S rRNA (adenine1518-N6/adenine1519-N6)-dimethyltransferase
VTAVELDDRLFPPLHEALADLTNVALRHADILACPPEDFFPGLPYKVVANVPYYITAAILRHFLESKHRPVLLVLTVQNEVADRLVAAPGHLSLLAVSVRFYATVEKVDVIKAGAFWPRPDVDSAVVRIDCQAQTEWEIDETRFFRIVRAGFAQKRKQLQKNLRALGVSRPQITAALAAAGIEGRRRAETLDLPEWVALVRALPD